MHFYQVEYASCRVRSQAGFQIRAATPGVDLALGEEGMDAVIRLGFYPPQDDAAAAPVAFRSLRLDCGRHLLQCSRYLGRDDTGREGNFRTRSLVAQDPAPLPLWAMDCYEWPGWLDIPHSAELPAVELCAPAGESFAYHELTLFLNEIPTRAQWLTIMLATLFLPPVKRRFVIRDEKENTPYWLACLTKLLPRAVANALAVSTCQPDAAAFDVAAIPPHMQVRTQAPLFSPVDGAAPPMPAGLPDSGRVYARRAVRLLQRRPEAVPIFLEELEKMVC